MNSTLSKSDFQLAQSCAKKLVYKKRGYPTANDTDEYMKMLAEGGYVVGKMATLLYPEGIEIEGDTRSCVEQTRQLLEQDEVVLFEAAIMHGQRLIRIDILKKQGNKVELIEVKAKSHDSEEENPAAKLKEYIRDVAYQYHVLTGAYPDFKVKPFLLMPDKSKRTTIDALAGWFTMQKDHENTETEELPAQQHPRFHRPVVKFVHDEHPDRDRFLQQLREEGILSALDVSDSVQDMLPEIESESARLLRILNEGISGDDFVLCKACKACEFNTPGLEKNGYHECWGDTGYTTPHIFDLYYSGSINSETHTSYLDELIAVKKTSLFDIDTKRLCKKNGEIGTRAARQLLQIEQTQNNGEWFSEDLAAEINRLSYPLHFIDFETYTGALPFHRNMRPYELLAFQWSCHTIEKPGAAPRHAEWIHTGPMFPDGDAFPNFEFARSLMRHIGDTGTPLMWATHENTTLRAILKQMPVFGINDKELEAWLTRITKEDKRPGRFVDMNQMTLKHYFHPYMQGRTSIKKVLPAVWSHHPYLHEIPWFLEYAPEPFLNGIIDPYDTLTGGQHLGSDEDEVVKGGTDAMRAYYRIRFDHTLSTKHKTELRNQLLQYCRLDTMAMVIIWEHWRNIVK